MLGLGAAFPVMQGMQKIMANVARRAKAREVILFFIDSKG
jgi:hypothetical protein